MADIMTSGDDAARPFTAFELDQMRQHRAVFEQVVRDGMDTVVPTAIYWQGHDWLGQAQTLNPDKWTRPLFLPVAASPLPDGVHVVMTATEMTDDGVGNGLMFATFAADRLPIATVMPYVNDAGAVHWGTLPERGREVGGGTALSVSVAAWHLQSHAEMPPGEWKHPAHAFARILQAWVDEGEIVALGAHG